MNYKKHGVSMVEIMMGVFLLALVLIPSLNVVISQTQTVTKTRDHSQAAFLAQKIFETAHSFSFKLLDADLYNNDAEKQKKTLEYKLKNDPNFNTYNLNGITYKLDNNYTSVDPIKTIGAAEDTIPSIYAFKYRIVYTGNDKREHHLDIQTMLSQR